MAKQTMAEKRIVTLQSWGFVQIPSKSGKYRTFKHEPEASTITVFKELVFIGRRGAVRVGPCATKSRSVMADPDKTMAFIARMIFR